MSEDEIKKMVNEILTETGLEAAPIPVVSIAEFYDFAVFEMPLEDKISGIIMVNDANIKGFDTNKVIIVNSLHSKGRKRFTIAHELAHYFIQGKPQTCFAHRDNGDYSREERDANSFASALLMPANDVKRKVKELCNRSFGEMIENNIINQIAIIFNVSWSAAEVRLKKLNLIKSGS